LTRARAALAAPAAAVIALCALAPVAGADVSVTSFQVRPSTSRAGAHPDVNIATDFSSSPASDDLKNLTVRLAPGLVGNPQSADRCTGVLFLADSCPAGSRVGAVSVTAQLIATSSTCGRAAASPRDWA
jgi:hypothetical protein